MIRDERIDAEVQALARLDLEGLRSVWRQHWVMPPQLRSPGLLRHAIAWRMQAAVFGDLMPAQAGACARREPRAELLPFAAGTKLTREWQGRVCEVEITDQGYRYQGVAYRSLSAIARTITGTRWNGRRFFGLGPANAP